MNGTNPSKYSQFRKFEYLQENSFEIHTGPSGSNLFKCLTTLRLREYKFKQSFDDSLNPICSYGKDIETSAYFFADCPNYSNEWLTLWNIKESIDRNILTNSDLQVPKILLYRGSYSNNIITKTLIWNAMIDFQIYIERFDVPLFKIEYDFSDY